MQGEPFANRVMGMRVQIDRNTGYLLIFGRLYNASVREIFNNLCDGWDSEIGKIVSPSRRGGGQREHNTVEQFLFETQEPLKKTKR